MACNEFQKRQSSIETTLYEDSLEAMNRDSTINVARILAESQLARPDSLPKHFVFVSAEPSHLPMLQKYGDTKKEAEEFLLTDEKAAQMTNIILRPGMVTHPEKRAWAYPLSVANDIGFNLSKVAPPVKDFLPRSSSINLALLTEFAVNGAMGRLRGMPEKTIWTNEEMNSGQW